MRCELGLLGMDGLDIGDGLDMALYPQGPVYGFNGSNSMNTSTHKLRPIGHVTLTRLVNRKPHGGAQQGGHNRVGHSLV